MKWRRHAHGTTTHPSLLIGSTSFFSSTPHTPHFRPLGLFSRQATSRNTHEEATPPMRPASVPSVMVQAAQTTKQPKSAQLARQSGASSANLAKREKRLTMTMAASEALGM